MEPEIKKLIDELNTAFAEFKKTNDQRLSELATKGSVDALIEQKLATLNKAMDEAEKKLNEAVAAQEKRADEIEKKLGRLSLGGGGDPEKEAAELKAFNIQRRMIAPSGSAVADVGAEEYRAYKSAFVSWIRRGDQGIMTDADRKAMSVGSDPDGGYLVPADLGGRIVQKVYETSPVRRIAAVETISVDALEGINDLDEAAAGWVAETGARTATSTPQVGKWRIPAEEMYAMPEATQKFLDDAAVDVEGWLARKVSSKMIRVENAAFVTGDGVGKPRGFTTYPTEATADSSRAWGKMEHLLTGSDGSFGTDPNGSDKLIELVHKLKEAYRTGAVWAMNRTTLGKARTLKDTDGGYIWLPTMMAGQPSTLLGYPIAELEDMPTYSTEDALAIAFGNFREGYQIVDRQGIRVLRDPFTNKPYVRFYTTRRVGGDVLNFEAIKFLKFGN